MEKLDQHLLGTKNSHLASHASKPSAGSIVVSGAKVFFEGFKCLFRVLAGVHGFNILETEAADIRVYGH